MDHDALSGDADSIPSAQLADAPRPAYLIADDHPSVILAVSQVMMDLLAIPASTISQYHTGQGLLDACLASGEAPHLVVLDLVMPGPLQRLRLVRSMLNANSSLRIVAYTADESPLLAQAVLTAGALAYVCKTSRTDELVKAIAAAQTGSTHLDASLDMASARNHPWHTLTESERDVLVALCRGVKPMEITENTGRSYKTVMAHKYNGLEKLGLRDIVDLLPYLYANGLVYTLDEYAQYP